MNKFEKQKLKDAENLNIIIFVCFIVITIVLSVGMALSFNDNSEVREEFDTLVCLYFDDEYVDTNVDGVVFCEDVSVDREEFIKEHMK